MLTYHFSKSCPKSTFNYAARKDNWCNDATINHLILDKNKTKELILSNARDNPSQEELSLSGVVIERVEEYEYLGTTITNKVKFLKNTGNLVKKARKKLRVMKKTTFMVTSGIVHNLLAIYYHLSAQERSDLYKITK